MSGSVEDIYRNLVLSQNLYEEAARRIYTQSSRPEISAKLKAELNASYAYLAGQADKFQELSGDYGAELTEQQRKNAEAGAQPREFEIKKLVDQELNKASQGFYAAMGKTGDMDGYTRWRWEQPESPSGADADSPNPTDENPSDERGARGSNGSRNESRGSDDTGHGLGNKKSDDKHKGFRRRPG